MYGAEAAEIYDLTHSARGKDFPNEAQTVLDLIRTRTKDSASLLDVACGTGAHLEVFGHHFDRVEGVDLSESMLEAARRRLPDVPVSAADMRDFDLGRTYSVVTCLFASVGYLATEAELTSALRCFARHLAPGGAVAVEPWWFPETFLPGHVAADVVESGGRRIARVSHTVRDGDASRMEVHYTVADSERGIRHFTETHRATLFTREQYESAFHAAGFDTEYVPGVQNGRGLFVAGLA
ncbi:class I SAM-dependent methyltransferase [Streptomyces sp. NPDC005805]|uniref:class I SAM-dependent methyltransferase n=1 Tax=Streptomyces sp. NPDC005805 TaxID=3157068 RepID=UPI0033F5CECD